MLFRFLNSSIFSVDGRDGFSGLVIRRKSLGNIVSLLDRPRMVLFWEALLLILLAELWELPSALTTRRDGLVGAWDGFVGAWDGPG